MLRPKYFFNENSVSEFYFLYPNFSLNKKGIQIDRPVRHLKRQVIDR